MSVLSLMSGDRPCSACALVLTAAAAWLCGAPAQAREGAAGTASARVIAPLTTMPVADLDFGTVGVSGGGGGSVIVGPAEDGAAYSGSARAVCGQGTGCPRPHPARFDVSGEAGRTYRVALPRSVSARADMAGAPDLEVADLALRTASQPATTNRGSLDAAGRDAFTVGGTLVLPRGTVPARYRAQIEVVVTYD